MARQELEALWTDQFEDGVPFSPRVNEETLLKLIKQIVEQKDMDKPLVKRVQQWIRFNKWINHYEDDAYHARVSNIYAHIEKML